MGQKSRLVYLLLILIVLLGLAIRLYDLDKLTITHVEISKPGIDLPANLSVPSSRLTVKATLFGMIFYGEPHPPGYYLFMLGWTRLTGTDIWWLRLPTAIFGAACVLLVFILAKQEKDQIAGLLAALLVALNGHQVYWSQIAKMYIPAEFFGLAATLALLLALKGGKWERLYQLAYVLATLLGISFTVYYWPILIVQMLWILVEKWRDRSLPGMFQVQYLTLLAGTPLISLAIFQARRESYISSNFLPSLAQFLEFGYAIEDIPPGFSDMLWIKVIPALLLIIGIIFLAAGILKARQDANFSASRGIPTVWLLAVTPISTLAIILFGRYFYPWFPEASRNVLISAFIPGFLFILYLGLRYLWERKRRLDLIGSATGFNYKLSAYLAVLPVVFVALATPVAALFASRGILLYTPFLLLTMAAGALALIRRSNLWIPVLLIAVITLPIGGMLFRNSTMEHPNDYKALAEKWIPEIRPGDLVFVRRHWATTPIFYYLDADKYQVVGDLEPDSYADAIRDHPDARIWVLKFPDLEGGTGLEQALAGYKVSRTLQALGIQVDLYEIQPVNYP